MFVILYFVLLVLAGVAGLRIGQKLQGTIWQVVGLILVAVLTLLGVIVAVALSSGVGIVLTTLAHVIASTTLTGMIF